MIDSDCEVKLLVTDYDVCGDHHSYSLQYGQTCLMLAARLGEKAGVQSLIRAGAELDVKDVVSAVVSVQSLQLTCSCSDLNLVSFRLRQRINLVERLHRGDDCGRFGSRWHCGVVD